MSDLKPVSDQDYNPFGASTRSVPVNRPGMQVEITAQRLPSTTGGPQVEEPASYALPPNVRVTTDSDYNPFGTPDPIMRSRGLFGAERPQATPSIVPTDAPRVQEVIPAEIAERMREAEADLRQRFGLNYRPEDVKAHPRLLDADIDVESGGPFWLRVLLQQARNPEEARLTLGKIFPPGKFGQDTQGNWWFDRGGRRTLILPDDGTFGAWAGRAAPSIVAEAPQIIGSIAAAIPPWGPQGTAASIGGRAIAAGLGGMVGEMAQNAGKAMAGTFAQSPREVARNLNYIGSLNAIGEAMGGLGRLGMNIVRRHWLGVTPESQDLTRRLMSKQTIGDVTGRYYPKISSVLPGAKALQAQQRFWESIVGQFGKKSSEALHDARFRQILKEFFPDPDELEKVLARLHRQGEVIPPQALGIRIGQFVDRKEQELFNKIADARARARRTLLNLEAGLKARADTTNPLLGNAFDEAVRAARIKFGTEMSEQYAAIDEALQGARVFPMETAVIAARDLVQKLNGKILKTELDDGSVIYQVVSDILPIPRMVKEIAELPPETNLSIMKAHEIRSALREELRGYLNSSPYMPGRSYYQANTVEKALDGTFRRLEDADSIVGDAAKQLRETGQQYAQGIRQFDNEVIAKIARDARDGALPNPEVIAEMVLSEGKIESTKAIMQVLGRTPEGQVVQGQIRDAYIKNLLEANSRLDPIIGDRVLSGASLLAVLTKGGHEEVMRAAGFAPREIADLKRFAQWLNAEQIDIPLSATGRDLLKHIERMNFLQPGKGVPGLLTKVVQQQMEYRKFIESDPISAILSMRSDPKRADEIVKMLLQPGNNARLQAAYDAFKDDPKIWEELQQIAVTRFLERTVEMNPNGTSKIISEQLKKNFSQLTDTQKKLLFPEGFIDDITQLVRDTDFIWPRSPGANFGVSLATAGVLLHVGVTSLAGLRGLMALFGVWAHGFLLSRPLLLRWLALESQLEPGRFSRLMKAVRISTLDSMLVGPGSGRAMRPEQADIMEGYAPVP